MKFMLVTMMLANPMTYADKATCEMAADALKSVDVEAVCIPAGEEAKNPGDKMLEGFLKIIEEMEKLHNHSGTTK